MDFYEKVERARFANLPNRPCKLAKKSKSLNKSGKSHFCMSNIPTFMNTTYSPVLTLYAYVIGC